MGLRNTITLLIFAASAIAELLPFSLSEERSYILSSSYAVTYPLQLESGIDRKLDVSTELGILFKVDDSLYVGPAALCGVWRNGGWHSRWGLAVCGRFPLGERVSLEIMQGAIIADSPAPDGFAGYTGGAAVMLDNWIGITAGLDLTKTFPEGHDTILRIGLNFGSLPGLSLTTLTAAAGSVAWWLDQMD